MRHNQMVLDQEGQLNAPDPRESNPPCYADAILLPRLKASFTSLKLSSFSDNTIRRGAKRTRSEEVLGACGLDPNQRPVLVARSRKRLDTWTVNDGDLSSAIKLIKNELTVDNDLHEQSFEIITQLETDDGHSPYAKRKPRPSDEFYLPSESDRETFKNQELIDQETDNALYQNVGSKRETFESIEHPRYMDEADGAVIYQNVAKNPEMTTFIFNSSDRRKSPSPQPSTSPSYSSFSSTSVDSDDYVRLPQRRSFTYHDSDI